MKKLILGICISIYSSGSTSPLVKQPCINATCVVHKDEQMPSEQRQGAHSMDSWTHPTTSHSELGDSQRKDKQVMFEYNAFMEAANRYITFLNNLGMTEEPAYPSEIFSLCAKNCKKVRNGKLLFEGCEHFADQLNVAKEWIGTWSIDVLDVIVSAESQSVVIRYALSTQKEGNLIVLVILRYNSNYMIYEINEVHNRLE